MSSFEVFKTSTVIARNLLRVCFISSWTRYFDTIWRIICLISLLSYYEFCYELLISLSLIIVSVIQDYFIGSNLLMIYKQFKIA